MKESDVHILLKKIGLKYLRKVALDRGIYRPKIAEEYRIDINGKTYILDLVLIDKGKNLIVIECGKTEQSKLIALKKEFNEVYLMRVEDVLRQYLKAFDNYIELFKRISLTQQYLGNTINLMETQKDFYRDYHEKQFTTELMVRR